MIYTRFDISISKNMNVVIGYPVFIHCCWNLLKSRDNFLNFGFYSIISQIILKAKQRETPIKTIIFSLSTELYSTNEYLSTS